MTKLSYNFTSVFRTFGFALLLLGILAGNMGASSFEEEVTENQVEFEDGVERCVERSKRWIKRVRSFSFHSLFDSNHRGSSRYCQVSIVKTERDSLNGFGSYLLT